MSRLVITVTAAGRLPGQRTGPHQRQPRDFALGPRHQEAGNGARAASTIRADARTTHQAVVTAMDVAGKLGFSQLNIATVHEGGSP